VPASHSTTPLDLAAAPRALADRVAQLDLAEVLREVPAHEHEPGILRDTVRCPACAATVASPPEKHARR
jgi:hypothetical protein